MKSEIIWIAQSQRKPADNVLVICGNLRQEKTFLGYFSKGMDCFFDKNGSGCIVSHWAELPTIGK